MPSNGRNVRVPGSYDPFDGRSIADRKGADDFHAWLDDYARQAAAGKDVSRRLAHARHDGTKQP